MKLYFAGAYTGLPIEKLKEFGIKSKLYSYYNEPKEAENWGSEGLMLDSGAFSAWSKNAKIDIQQLTDFIKRISPEHSIQLDVIGNEDATWDNYLQMSSQVQVLPVIHYQATEKHINRVLESAEYICLGALVPLSGTKTLLHWLDYLYSFPAFRNKKIHILGIMTKTVLQRYPFYSADSSSALSLQRYPSKDLIERTMQKTRHYTDNYELGIRKQVKLEKYITDLWTSRGIIWE